MCLYVWGCLGLRRDEWKTCVSWASRRLPVIFFTRAAQSCPVCLRSLLINASVISPEPGWSNPAEPSGAKANPIPPSLLPLATPSNRLHPSQKHPTYWLNSLCIRKILLPIACSTLRKSKGETPTVAPFSGFGICLAITGIFWVIYKLSSIDDISGIMLIT